MGIKLFEETSIKVKKVIINADDFGISKSVNLGMVEAFKKGVLTSVSFMSNMPAFKDAVCHIKNNSDMGVGIHLNINLGRPVLPSQKVKTLINRDGLFLSNNYQFIKKLYLRQFNLSEVENEFRSQIEKVKNENIKMDHIDSHRHIHMFPQFFQLITKLAKEYDIPVVRFSCENLRLGSSNNYYHMMQYNWKYIRQYFYDLNKLLLLKILASFDKKILKKSCLKKTDYFFGVFLMGRMRFEQYIKIFNIIGDGYTEIACHPGYIDNEFIATNDSLIEEREEELRTLLDPRLKQAILRNNISLVTFAEISKDLLGADQ